MGYENALFVAIIIGLILFGSNKIPEIARALGRAQYEFEKAKSQTMLDSNNNDSIKPALKKEEENNKQ
jgi:sec-independent protein translocase protein TatA